MKQNGDILMFALVNLLVGGIAACLGFNMLLKNPIDVAGYMATLGGLCLVSFSWFITSAAHFRSSGTTPWWSSRRLFQMSKSETKLV